MEIIYSKNDLQIPKLKFQKWCQVSDKWQFQIVVVVVAIISLREPEKPTHPHPLHTHPCPLRFDGYKVGEKIMGLAFIIEYFTAICILAVTVVMV